VWSIILLGRVLLYPNQYPLSEVLPLARLVLFVALNKNSTVGPRNLPFFEVDGQVQFQALQAFFKASATFLNFLMILSGWTRPIQ
jgi:hypothetical protein